MTTVTVKIVTVMTVTSVMMVTVMMVALTIDIYTCIYIGMSTFIHGYIYTCILDLDFNIVILSITLRL